MIALRRLRSGTLALVRLRRRPAELTEQHLAEWQASR